MHSLMLSLSPQGNAQSEHDDAIRLSKRADELTFCISISVPGVLFWFAPLQHKRTRSPDRKVGASAFLVAFKGRRLAWVDEMENPPRGGLSGT